MGELIGSELGVAAAPDAPMPGNVRRTIYAAAAGGASAWCPALVQLWLRAQGDPGASKGFEEAVLKALDAYQQASNWVVRPGAAELLQAAGAAGMKAVVLSNWGPGLGDLVGSLGLARNLSAVLSSTDIAAAKPSFQAYRSACMALDTPAERVLHIGDDPVCDYRGARLAGVKAFLVAPKGPIAVPDFDDGAVYFPGLEPAMSSGWGK